MPKIAVLLPEETNYLRIANLILRVAPPAVRVEFNNQFHPDVLQKTINEQRFLKILESLKRKRIINKAQWDNLFPKTDEVSSNSFDLTLMICLIRHLIPVDVGEFLPVDPKNISVGADLSRLKYYRNQVAHSEAGVLTDKTFENYWNDITQAIVRLGGVAFQQRCVDLKVISLNDSDKEILAEIRSMNREYDPVPKGLRETNGEEIEEWEQVSVAETRAVKRIAELIKTEGIVVAIGSSGCGKSTAIHRAAEQFCDLNGYDIILVYTPDEIRQNYNPECKQLFVIDDLCGKPSINMCLVNSWERLSKFIKKILKRSEVKILSSCRNYIYRDRLFQNLTVLVSSICDLTSSYSLTHDERIEIAHIYLSASDVKYLEKSNCLDRFDFFPLLCKMYPNQTFYNIESYFSNPDEVVKNDLTLLMTSSDQKTMATLMLFIAYNNSLNKKQLMQTSSLKPILKSISSHFSLQTFLSDHAVMSELDNLTQSYVKRSGNSYCINHDNIFGILILFFGEIKLDLVLKIAHTCIIRDRFIFKSVLKENLKHDNTFDLIQIPEELEQTYFDRLLRDIENGFISNVFSNKQLKYENFRKKFFHFPGSDKSMKDILLHLSPYELHDLLVLSIDQGYFDIVSLLLTVGKNLQCMLCLNSPVYRATVKGYADIVKLLLDYNFNPTCIGDDGTPFEVAVKNNFGCIVKLLLDHNDMCCFRYSMTYYICIAAKKGYIDMVKMLLEYSTYTCLMQHIVDLGIPLCIAAKKGHINIVKMLLDNKASPNSMNLSSETPLALATAKRHIGVVKMLLEYKANPDIGYHDFQYVRPLFIAVKNGDINITKVLLDNGASQDFTDSPSKTPLSIATAEGHIDIVKLLLKHMSNIDQSADLGYPICIASNKGYTNIVKLLLDNNASANYMTLSSDTPLSLATAQGYSSIVKILLEHGANPDFDFPNNADFFPALLGANPDFDFPNNADFFPALLLLENTTR